MEIKKMGFLDSCTFENGSTIRGAILITDPSTKPFEFRVTSPIRPTDFQQTIYGKILAEHILVDLITIPLLNSIKEKPDIIFVRNSLFLKSNDKITTIIIRIFKQDEPRSNNRLEPGQVSPLGGEYEPFFVETSNQYQERLNEFRKFIIESLSNCNIFEPFERISIACQQVHAKKIGEAPNVSSNS